MPSPYSENSEYNPTLLSSNPRATLAEWLRYQPVVREAFKAFPEPFVFTPHELSCSTFVSRVRDAIRGAIGLGHPISFTDTATLCSWREKIVFKYNRTHVFIGTPETVRQEITGELLYKSSTYEFQTLSTSDVAAFCQLLSSGRIQGPVIVRNGTGHTPPSFPNLEILFRDDGSLILL